MLEAYRKMKCQALMQEPIVLTYEELFNGIRKGLPKGTWRDDKNTILLIRYVLEIRLKLSAEQIPMITKNTIKDQKLWGALNRFKSIKKMLHFVYPSKYDEFDFHRVPADYWADSDNIKSRIEFMLQKHKIAFQDIPKHITNNCLISWGLSNPLKRYNYSPFRLINEIYPNVFKPYHFRKMSQDHIKNHEALKEHFLDMLEKEKITFHDIPQKVIQEVLYKHRFTGAMSHYNNSTSKFIMALFPNDFVQEDFIRPQGYWHDVEAVRNTIINLTKKLAIPYTEIPKRLTKKLLAEHGLSGLLDRYSGSPINIVEACFPGEFDVLEFQRVPNRHWYRRENRIKALRTYCKKHQIDQKELPKLCRAYFRKNFPRFVSVLDRHYESKIHLWIIEAFPEYNFYPSDFDLLVGEDGQLCDSKEELLIHNTLIRHFKDAKVIREGKRFINEHFKESYLPDWIVKMDGKEIIVEYFGLYGSNRFPGYTERADRKMDFYETLNHYEFIKILPGDLRRIDTIFIDVLEKDNNCI